MSGKFCETTEFVFDSGQRSFRLFRVAMFSPQKDSPDRVLECSTRSETSSHDRTDVWDLEAAKYKSLNNFRLQSVAILVSPRSYVAPLFSPLTPLPPGHPIQG